MLDQPDPPEVGEADDTSPTQLHGSYPPQFDQQQQQQPQPRQQQHAQAQPPQEYYQQSFGAQIPPPQHVIPPQQHFGEQQQQQAAQQAMPVSQPQPSVQSGGGGQFGMGAIIDPNDPMLDADPFGLSASMHYPTAYSALDHPQNAR
jgi:hypothetical protein